ncbi:hypothetical protein BDP27DRAFT_1373565 [Rhodocollybia butyracea]|uniref:Uncharacterized protein n=1 Tax=Rhodocollybia butyracea TaxID=206335 RepID=A0A9P5P909_9AGAR|nr:hypothetical protein BDP27DRAFT_1373565 [Rhodocollybia butyracea]
MQLRSCCFIAVLYLWPLWIDLDGLFKELDQFGHTAALDVVEAFLNGAVDAETDPIKYHASRLDKPGTCADLSHRSKSRFSRDFAKSQVNFFELQITPGFYMDGWWGIPATQLGPCCFILVAFVDHTWFLLGCLVEHSESHPGSTWMPGGAYLVHNWGLAASYLSIPVASVHQAELVKGVEE